ncbi:MAG: hypothetical protein CMN78_04675 [Spirochaetales bacterium]|nr:hypothetical protein [Spirochaetales bacterium]
MKQSRSMLPVLSLLLLLSASFLSAQEINLEPTPYVLKVALEEEPLPMDSLITSAFVLSATPMGEIPGLSQNVAALQNEMAAEIQPDWPPYRTGEYILEFLHRKVFIAYDEYQTRVDVALQTGRFNCVSSAVLYLIFARSAGLTVQGVSTADHAFCSVILPGEIVDVETTTFHGFDPGKKKEFVDDFGNITGYSYVPPSDYAKRNSIGEKGLLSLILQNRISLLERRRQFADTIELSVDRYVFSPDADTEGHMVRAFLNYAALLNEGKRYVQAINFLDRAVERYGWKSDYQKIFGVLSYNIVVDLIQRELYEDALQKVEVYRDSGWIGASNVDQLGSQIAERMLARDLKILSVQEGIGLAGELYDKGLLKRDRFLEYAVMLHIRHSEELASAGDYLGAEERIGTAIAAIGPDNRLINARDVYLHNYAVGVHNRFASLFNNQEYSVALRLIEAALERYPESTILQGDLSSIKRVISTNSENHN